MCDCEQLSMEDLRIFHDNVNMLRRNSGYENANELNNNVNVLRRNSAQGKLNKKYLNELVKLRDSCNKKQVNFGICFDIDGVLARGTRALPGTQRAFEMLTDERGQFKVPTVFLTNSLNKNADKAAAISAWADREITASQMIHCQGPLEVFTKYHDKFCLIVGQGKIPEIVEELGFSNYCTLDEIAEAYPLLDVVDHDNRKRNAAGGYVEKDFPRVEAIILLGEPKKWDQALQLLVDLLVTDGKPDKAPETYPEVHLPIIACNMDLQFMDLACMPRYGHGAFLVCLEALYQKVSGNELQYTTLIGKPSEISFRFAEHCLSREAKKLGINGPLTKMYLVGDTPEVDIVGTNLYQRFIDRLHMRRNDMDMDILKSESSYSKKEEDDLDDPDLPVSRNIPVDARFSQQTVEEIDSVLVCTGVYNPQRMDLSEIDEKKQAKGHRDFPVTTELYKPTTVQDDVAKAVEYILQKENVLW